ncbi:MAG: hypothetical protein IJ894_15150 [Bacteroidales bacterium]|nr:hypothetical protein [Bacteroidales bacterium]
MKIFYKSQKIFFGKPKCENVLTFFYFFLWIVVCCWAEMMAGQGFRNTVIPIFRYSEEFESLLWGKMGNLGYMGLMGADIPKISSEKNKNSSTLFKISSELKNFCSELIFYSSKHP